MFHNFKKIGNYFLNILKTIFIKFLLFAEEPCVSGSLILDVTLEISDAKDRCFFCSIVFAVANENELIIGVPAEFVELQEKGKDIIVFVLAKDESLVLINLFIPIFQERIKNVVVDL